MPQVIPFPPVTPFSLIQGPRQLAFVLLRKKTENKARKLSQKEEKQVKREGREKRMKPKERFRKVLGSEGKGGERQEDRDGKKGNEV